MTRFPLYEERLVAAVVLPGQTHEDFTRSPDLAVEMSALLGRRGAPLYQLIITDLTRQRVAYTSTLYESPHLASTEWARETGEWLAESEYRETAA